MLAHCLFNKIITTKEIAMPAIFTLVLWLELCTLSSSTQLTPIFQLPTDAEATRPFPSINTFHENKIYRPTYPTVFYQMYKDTDLKIDLTIANMVKCLDTFSAWKFKIKYICTATSPEDDIKTGFNTSTNSVLICDRNMQISIYLSDKYISNSTCTISLQIQTAAFSNENIQDPLNHFQLLRISVPVGKRYYLVTQNIYLKIWRWPSKFLHKAFITKESEDFLISMKPSNSTSEFLSQQFLTPYAINLIKGLPELTKSLLSIGVLIQVNAFDQNSKHLSLMTDNYPGLTDSDSSDMKIMRIDWETGVMQYSLHGLRDAINALVQISKDKNYCTDENIKNLGCAVVRVTKLFYHSLLSQDVQYDPNAIVMEKNVKHDTYLSDDNVVSTCKVLQNYSKSVTVFAGVEKTILCPIICSKQDTLYGFYKNSEPLAVSPFTEKKFTRFGSVLVLKSGSAIRFDTSSTYVDSGMYKCRAGDLNAEFQVNVVALPSFNVTNTALTGGYLPPKVFVFEGDDYSLNCTAFYSGMKNVSFYGYVNSIHEDLMKQNVEKFEKLFSNYRYNTTMRITYTNTMYSSTATIHWVANVPPHNRGFHHTYKCFVGISSEDAQRFGIKEEFNTYTETSVIVIERLTQKDFITNHTNCCRKECTDNNVCEIEISLRAEKLTFLNTVGIAVRANFMTHISLLKLLMNKSAKIYSSFEPANARLIWRWPKGIKQMDENEATLFTNMIPVFRYKYQMALWGGISQKLSFIRNGVSTNDEDNRQVGASCLQETDKTCVYSTALNKQLSDALSVATLLGVNRSNSFNFTKDGDESRKERKETSLNEWNLMNRNLKNRNAENTANLGSSRASVVAVSLVVAMLFIFFC